MTVSGRPLGVATWVADHLVAGVASAAPPALIRAAAHRALLRNSRGVDTLRVNLAQVTGGPVTDAILGQAIASYARYWQELISGTSRRRNKAQIAGVRPEGAWADLEARVESGRGAIVALPHMGNWDLAGAWATSRGHSVATVAERVSPEWLYRAFLRRRLSAGLQVLPHDERDKSKTLGAHLGAGGVVALVCDRHMSGGAGRSALAGENMVLPTGVLELASSQNVPIYPVALRYEDQGMVIDVGEALHLGPDAPLDDALAELGSRLTWGDQHIADRLAHAPTNLQPLA